jgi:unsaturated rhamnogalacturonyl hydrolase
VRTIVPSGYDRVSRGTFGRPDPFRITFISLVLSRLSTRAARNAKCLLLACIFLLPAGLLCAQTQEQNGAGGTNGITAYDQKGIDEDIARHLGDVPADAGPKAKLSASLNPAAVRTVIAKVAAWELARMQPYFTRNWTFAALYTGLMAASRATGDPRYNDAVEGMGEKFHWQLEMEPRWPHDNKPFYDANDQCVAQSYLELYFETPEPQKIGPTRAALDDLAAGNTAGIPADEPQIAWWWADALYMAPPAETRMYAATHDRKYLEYMDERWWETWDLLYDRKYHLYYRDASYLHSKNAQGYPVFWSRGNGWAMGGLVRLLDYLPNDDPSRPRFESQLREMAAEVASIQDPKNGLWHADLLDAVDFPRPEVSGSSFIAFALAWGVNHGVLDRATYMPVIAKAWRGLVAQIYADGRLGNIQQTGAYPAHYLPTSSYNYGVGAFLVAGEQVAKLEAPSGKTAPGHKAR